ncbi:MAG: TldD/PmbA family protein [Patescibacteria group bacterium]|nr:TldD/PmbA family protein [Patescibacteria group bacterium]MCL5093784.1 TldD/PmbA family protein [Patescibacteria group bacterium]
MKETVQKILDGLKSKGASYADIRIIASEAESIEVKNGIVEALEIGNDYGFGIRVLYKGAWGFASSYNVEPKEIERIALEALEVAKASSLVKKEDIVLASVEKYIDSYKTPIKIDPFTVHLNKKISYLLETDKILRKEKGIKVSSVFFKAGKEIQTFISTEGSVIDQEIWECGGGMEAMAISKTEVQNRSYPNSHSGQVAAGGYEVFESLKLKENAERIAKEAVELLKAPQCPSGEFDIILDSTQLALQVHESCGHPVELDRAFGMEASYAGTSFLTPEKLGDFKFGSKLVNIYADATAPGGLGTFGYDDEGVKAQKFPIIKNGIFVNYLTSRETAQRLGQKSNGTMRADGWTRIPLIRMTNINLEPGEWKLDDLIADTENGIFMSTNKEWSIDDKRLNFQFGCEIAWEIKNGKLGRILKNPTYQGITPEFWGSLDAICNKDHWQIWGVPNCGKGEPSQLAHVGHGTAPARFRKVKVGVGKW